MGRFALSALLLSPLLISGVVAEPLFPLSPRQTILEADRHLVADGWQPSPEQTPSSEERRLAAVDLKSLSACSGTGIGFCRFDYQRKSQRLSVVTVPSEPGRPSIGRVERWW